MALASALASSSSAVTDAAGTASVCREPRAWRDTGEVGRGGELAHERVARVGTAVDSFDMEWVAPEWVVPERYDVACGIDGEGGRVAPRVCHQCVQTSLGADDELVELKQRCAEATWRSMLQVQSW